jgi:hypothetical protein
MSNAEQLAREIIDKQSSLWRKSQPPRWPSLSGARICYDKCMLNAATTGRENIDTSYHQDCEMRSATRSIGPDSTQRRRHELDQMQRANAGTV